MVLFKSSRTGSNWFNLALNNYPIAGISRNFQFKSRSFEDMEARLDPREWEKEHDQKVISGFSLDPLMAFSMGFDVLAPGELHARSKLKRLLTKYSPRLIHMARRNSLRQAVSYLTRASYRVVNCTGRVAVEPGTECIGAGFTKQHVDPDALLVIAEKFKRQRLSIDQFMSELELPSLTLYYEDIMKQPEWVVSTALNYIGAETWM